MPNNFENDFEAAKALFYRRDFPAAYGIFRRLFDRLPFEVTSNHALCIAYFSRILLELGKEFELKFYLNTIERLYEKNSSTELAYQLALIRAVAPDWARDLPRSRLILENILKTTVDPKFVARAKILLAYIFDTEADDTAACRKIIFSMEPVGEREIDALIEIWKAKILRDEKKYEEAECQLVEISNRFPFKENWYVHFSAMNILAILYLRTGRIEKAVEIHSALTSEFKGKKMRLTQLALNVLESELKKISQVGRVVVTPFESGWELRLGERKYVLSKGNSAERLLRYLLKEGFIERSTIIDVLFNRKFNPGTDNKTVYYHVHNLREYLADLGLPANTVALEKNGYRFIPEVEFVEL